MCSLGPACLPLVPAAGRVALGDAEDLAAGGNAALDKGNKVRAGGGKGLHLGVERKEILIGARLDGALSADDADFSVARGGHGAAHRRRMTSTMGIS